MSRSAIAASGHTFRTKNISKRVQKIVISPIKEMSILADDFAHETGADIISFGQGIPYVDTPPNIKRAIKKALDELSTAKYTLEPGITELRGHIAKFLTKSKKIKNINSRKEIMVSAGCQEALCCALASVVDPGDEVLIPEPSFASYTEQIIQLGATPVQAPLNEKAGWKIDIAACAKKITKKTKAIIFCNPMNPTGAVLSQKEVDDLAKLAIKHDLIVITDETYDFLTYDGVKHISPASVPALRDRVILCGSFSKKFAMTGYRVGYAFADKGIIDHMLKVHDAMMICAPAISQKAAIEALSGPQDSVKLLIKKLTANRNAMCAELDKLSEFVSYHKPKGAYYILVRIKRPNIDSFKLTLRILYEANVIVIPGAAFGPSGENHIRFSFAGDPKKIKQGFARLTKWFTKWKAENYKL